MGGNTKVEHDVNNGTKVNITIGCKVTDRRDHAHDANVTNFELSEGFWTMFTKAPSTDA
jgi:hypothetical protein